MKGKKALWLFAPLLACAVLAGGCSFDTISVTSIELTSSNGLEDTYTVNYSNGTSSTFTVKNGRDITVQDLFNRYKEEYGDDLTYEGFLEKYLTLTDASAAVISEALASSFEIKATNGYSTNAGSGVLYAVNETKNEAYVITNYHVTYISGSFSGNVAANISCTLFGSDQTSLSCTYIGGSASSDIALLKVDLQKLLAVNACVKPVKVATDYCVGERVYAIGNAEGYGISATTGIVSVDSENVTMSVDGTKRTHRAMRIDAAIYHGNSGGGLFNAKGELIGITNGGSEDDENINYAIPLSLVTGTADNILHYYADSDTSTFGAYKPELGFTANIQNSRYLLNGDTGRGYIKEDIVIDSVKAFSIASNLSLRAKDIVTAIEVNGVKHLLNRSYEIYDLLLTVRAGDKIKVCYTRTGLEKETSVYTLNSGDLQKID